MPSLEDDGRKKRAAIPKQEIPGVGGPPPTFNKSLAAGDRGGALPFAELHIFAEGTKVILEGPTALQYNGQVGKILKNCTTASVREMILVPWSTGPRAARRTQHTFNCENYRGGEAENHQEQRTAPSSRREPKKPMKNIVSNWTTRNWRTATVDALTS